MKYGRKNNNRKKVFTSLYIEEELQKDLRALRDKYGVSISWMINKAVRNYIATKKRQGKYEEGDNL